MVKIRKLLERDGLDGVKGVKCGSVEEFQGHERDVVIISTVRADRSHFGFDQQHRLGFVASPKRFNVAVTRARKLLIVVGSPAVLAGDRCWAALLRAAVAAGAYVGCPLPAGFETEGGAAPPETGLAEALEALALAGPGAAGEEAAGARAAAGEEAPALRALEEGAAWRVDDV